MSRPTARSSRAFETTADRQVELGLSSKADGKRPSRKVTVVPVGSDGELRRRAWIERNRAYVTEASKGRLAYVYMPDTGPAGIAAFDRDFYAQLDKQGLVLDERYNGGGKIADYVVSVLARKVLCYWRTRDASWLGRTPFAYPRGPEGDADQRARGLRAATPCRGCSSSWASARWSACGPGAGSSASPAIRR